MMTAKSLLLVHGAGSGPWAFDGWADSFAEIEVAVPDLQEGLNVSQASMSDYTDRVVAEGRFLTKPLALCGWSMGGLVAMMAVSKLNPEALILIEASPPGEVQGFNEHVEPTPGVFVYPGDFRSRPESQYARDERKRGISVPVLPDRTLVISGRDYSNERGRQLAAYYGVRLCEFPALRHWELSCASSVKNEVRQFLGLTVRNWPESA